jgi:hypothetical protein
MMQTTQAATNSKPNPLMIKFSLRKQRSSSMHAGDKRPVAMRASSTTKMTTMQPIT